MSKDLFNSNTLPETRKQYLKRRRREEYTRTRTPRKNPMILLHGATEGKKCKTCVYLCYREFAKKYYKCKIRGVNSNPRLDHKVNFPACGKYEELLIIENE